LGKCRCYEHKRKNVDHGESIRDAREHTKKRKKILVRDNALIHT